MLRDDGQLAPGLYRVTLEDGTTGDYELTGHSQHDHGDLVIFQPTMVGEIAHDAQLAASRIVLVVSEDGHVWHIPGNRLKDAEPVEGEQLDSLAAAYLKQAPFHPPTRDGRMTAAERRALAGLPKPAEAVEDREDEAYPAGNPRRNPETSGVSEPITPDPKARRRSNGPAAERTVATGETPGSAFGADITDAEAHDFEQHEMNPPPGAPPDPLTGQDALTQPGDAPPDQPSQTESTLQSGTQPGPTALASTPEHGDHGHAEEALIVDRLEDQVDS